MDYQKILEEIKNRLDIVEVISEYVNLTKTGQNYKALCPFHNEKTPSFFVSPSKQIFHCFGCGKGGDILSFLMEYEKISFSEAISLLASKAGIEIKLKSQVNIPKDKLYQIYYSAAEFYSENLKTSQKAMTYLKERGINSETTEIFRIGYAPNQRDGLYQYLKQKGFEESLIKISRLINNSSDFFIDRLIIPIIDLTGKVLAFGGRLLEEKTELPKYINSSDTPIFKKGETVFGLYQARQFIKEKGYAILVEGYMDVILCHQHGIRNTIAPLGTALTQEQLNKIKKFTNKILIIFDGDEAGIQAVERNLSILFQKEFIVKIVLLSPGDDPASILQKYGEKPFKNFVSKALSPVEFYLKAYSKKNLNDITYDCLKKICYVKNLIYRDELIKELSEKTSIQELTLREELRKICKSGQKEKSLAFKDNVKFLNEEETLLRVAICFPHKLPIIFAQIDNDKIENKTVKEIFTKLKEIFDRENFSLSNLLNLLNEEQKTLISRLIITSEITEDSITQILNDCIKKIKIKFIDKKIKEISKSGDEKYLQRLIKERKEILKGQI